VDTNSDKIDVNQIDVEIESDHSQMALFSIEKERNTAKTFQIKRKYILSNLKNSVVVIKQNLAHQRIVYEELLKKITVDEAVSQQLLIPMEIDFAKPDVALLFETKTELENIGFQFTEFKSDGILLNGIPTTIPQDKIVATLEEILDNIKLEVPDDAQMQLDIIIKSMAKSLAIKTGQLLNNKEQEDLIDKLFSCKEPNRSPYGKTTFITLPFDELEQKFS
jgi:DNA mismatch repair protein MutL